MYQRGCPDYSIWTPISNIPHSIWKHRYGILCTTTMPFCFIAKDFTGRSSTIKEAPTAAEWAILSAVAQTAFPHHEWYRHGLGENNMNEHRHAYHQWQGMRSDYDFWFKNAYNILSSCQYKNALSGSPSVVFLLKRPPLICIYFTLSHTLIF